MLAWYRHMAVKIWVNKGQGNNFAWRHQAITRTNVHLSSVRSSYTHMKATSQKTPQPSIAKISWNITFLKLYSNFPGTNEFKRHLYIPKMNKADDAADIIEA